MEQNIKKLEKIVEYLQDYAESCDGLTGEEYQKELITLIDELEDYLEELQAAQFYHTDYKAYGITALREQAGEEREYKSVKHKPSRTIEVTIERKGKAQPKPYNQEREN